jgi:hypothetical protein
LGRGEGQSVAAVELGARAALDGVGGLGYLERIPDPDDKRAKLIRLTAMGEQAQSVGFGLFAGLEQRLGERYGADRIAALRELLEEVAATEAPQAVPELSGAARAAMAGA